MSDSPLDFTGAATVRLMPSHIPAMLLAAGRGERMRPLTDATPKPLLRVRGKPLLQWHVDALAAAGFDDFVVNTAWLGEQFPAWFGSDTRVRYSHEGRDFGGALETAGGIVRALPLLGPMFWVVAGDVYAPDFVFSQEAVQRFAAGDKLAHLWLVPNPPHHPQGDFGLSQGLALNQAPEKFTYSTIGLYRAEFFTAPWCAIPSGNPQGVKAPLAPMLRAAMDNQQVSAELYTGFWADVGTPERLEQLNREPAPT